MEKRQHISHDEERRLGRLAKAGDIAAKHEFIDAFQSFAMWVARGVNWCNAPMDELNQACMLGLLESFERYDPERSTRFITMAYYGVRRRALEVIKEFTKTPHRYSLEGGIPGKYQNREPKRTVSMDTVMIGDDSGEPQSLGSTIADDRCQEPMDIVGDTESVTIATGLIGKMKQRTRRIVRLRIGTDKKKPMSFADIAKLLKISAERVRRIYNRAMDRVRGSVE
jgi:RNA polymerase sigma factor (sigma-70 family)